MNLKVLVIALILSVGFAEPMSGNARKQLIYALGKSQFIEINCDSRLLANKNVYVLCGRTAASFELFSAFLDLYLTTGPTADVFDWVDAWKESASGYNREFTLSKRTYYINFNSMNKIQILSDVKQ